MHNDYFSILNSSVTEQQIIAAGYVKGITRRKLDGSQFLVQCHVKLPAELEPYVIVKNQNCEQICAILRGPDWTDMTAGI